MASQIPKKTRQRVFDRDQYCQGCGKEGTELHHIIFRSHASPGWMHDFRNLILLCHRCHTLAHQYKKQREKWERWQKVRYGTEWQVSKGIHYKQEA